MRVKTERQHNRIKSRIKGGRIENEIGSRNNSQIRIDKMKDNSADS